ncbi:Ribosome biogenesis protein brx1 [Phlyctochytrium planicorne]|nr:Ribosome biogenesis protein brx1 [Phlyctochytrium planicorne]
MPNDYEEDFDISDDSEEGSDDERTVVTGRKALLKAASSAAGEEEEPATKEKKKDGVVKTTDMKRRNKQRVLALSSRGITQRYRHLLMDMITLMPHSKKDSKLDSKSKLHILNELAADSNCNNCIFFEVRKHKDLYMWVSKTPSGPSVRFHVQNVHTMDELRMTGNCLKGSRPILSFDQNFDTEPHYQLLKEMFCQVFGTPRTSRKLKPFIDHVLSFSIAGDKVWFRNYQVVHKDQKETGEISLVEIGPRFSMTIMKIFSGSFTGQVLYENPDYVSPNEMRRQAHIADQVKAATRTLKKNAKEHKELFVQPDLFKDVFK